MTAAEERYLRARDRLDPGDAGRRYLASLGDVYAGYALKDAWPRPAYLLVHFTRDPRGTSRRSSASPASRARCAPTASPTPRVATPPAGPDRRDERALASAGFKLEGTSVDDDSNRVEVELVTTRDDAAAYFRKRYGPVKTVVIATEPTELECNNLGRTRSRRTA